MKHKRKPKAKEFFLTVEECDSWTDMSLEERALLLRPQIHSVFVLNANEDWPGPVEPNMQFMMFKSFFLGNSKSNYINMHFFFLNTQKTETLVGIPSMNRFAYPGRTGFQFQSLRNILCVPEYSP